MTISINEQYIILMNTIRKILKVKLKKLFYANSYKVSRFLLAFFGL